ncbi:Polyamine aminopropyltransferase [Candidatus Desulfarcum epimagneticum]|uniref:Polyamine aminopropyltransferase n=1 Tax=uncultured Desulfobacteraceae bacterium TaxID=218296 RepID=A0A484HKR3_9BACT|nr:Polyamine aminopropyltransferase [uncultured Desulfobacteraceae bacterium]
MKASRAGLVLKTSILATGCAGIVAEYALSTLAAYLIGNAVFQWTIIMSLMLFSMGVGSRLSRRVGSHLIETFFIVEIGLSVLCASSTTLVYGVSFFIRCADMLIYALAICVGILIGFEIPLVTRLNQSYEELRENIASIMEKDYYGALVGGIFFAFVALPRLGLTYTPIVLGAVNFAVAGLVMAFFYRLIEKKKLILSLFGLCFFYLIALAVMAKPIVLFGEQKQYKDRIVYAEQTVFQKIVLTRWKDFHWLFINGQTQFSSFDEEKYHEPLVHPALKLAANRRSVLILGGGDGLAAREILKYPDVRSLTVVDLDPAMTRLAKTHPVLLSLNRGALNDPRVRVINRDAAAFLREDANLYGVIVADLPDPDTLDLARLYSLGFYHEIKRRLVRGGVFVTQATSPYFSEKAFLCVKKTIREAGFSVLAYHNHIPTMGEWGWVLGARAGDPGAGALKKRAPALDFSDLDLKFLNPDAMMSMTHFGKGSVGKKEKESIRVNTKLRPALHGYYLSGSWGPGS